MKGASIRSSQIPENRARAIDFQYAIQVAHHRVISECLRPRRETAAPAIAVDFASLHQRCASAPAGEEPVLMP